MRRWQSPIRGSFPGKKTEAAGSLPPPPNNGDKKKGNCLGLRLRGPAAAKDAGRADRNEEADDREERAHFRNRSQVRNERELFETTRRGHIGVAEVHIHVDEVVRVGARKRSRWDVEEGVARAAAMVAGRVELHRVVAASCVHAIAKGAELAEIRRRFAAS